DTPDRAAGGAHLISFRTRPRSSRAGKRRASNRRNDVAPGPCRPQSKSPRLHTPGARSERGLERSVNSPRPQKGRENFLVIDRVDSGRTRAEAAAKIGGAGEGRIDLSPHHVDA